MPRRRSLTEAQKQIAAAERERLEIAFITLYCQIAGITRERFDGIWLYGCDGGNGPAKYRQLVAGRKWLWDFVARGPRIALEVNGGQGAGDESGHGSWSGLQRDAEKQNAAVLAGWRPYVLTTSMVDRRNPEQIQRLVDYLTER